MHATAGFIRPPNPLALLVIGSAALLVACGSDTTDPGTPGPIQRVVVTPAVDTLLAVGSTVQLTAQAFDDDGNEVVGASFGWSSSDASVASVDANGLAESLGNGVAEITASAGDATGTAQLAVAQRVTQVTVSPTGQTLTSVGETVQLTASATDANATPVEGAEFVWQSENDAVATVDTAGVVTARGAGTAAITVTAQDVPGYATVTVDQQIERLAFRTEPTSAVAGQAIDPAVRVEVLDAAGERVEDADLAVTVGLGANPGGGTLAGTRVVSTTAGVATFSGLWIDAAASGYTLEATASGATAATSAAFDIAVGPAARVAFRTQPSDVTAGSAITPAVQAEIQDAFGNLVSDATDQVSIALAANPGGGTVHGTVSAAASGGIATFSDLWLDRAANGYALSAAAPGLSGGTSGPFAVGAAEAARIGFVGSIPGMEAQTPSQAAIEVAVQDRFGNVVDTTGVAIQFSLVANATDGQIAGNVTATSAAGVAQLTGVTVDRPGYYTLGAGAPDLEVGESPAFHVSLMTATISAGHAHTCALSASGRPFCWGSGEYGRLGTGAVDPRSTPAAVRDGSTDAWSSISTGLLHSCGVTQTTGRCWGDNRNGQLGTGGTTNEPTPRYVATGSWTTIAAGAYFTCGIDTGQDAYCWGGDGYGALGTGSTGSFTPDRVADPPSGAVSWASISASTRSYACGVTTTGEAYCWGRNDAGQLGDNTTTNRSTPVAVADPATGPVVWSMISTGSTATCGVTTSGDAYCWGSNFSGKLGDGTTTDRPIPTPVSDPVEGAVTWTEVSGGGSHTCGLTAGGDIYCWGYNGSGMLGNGTTTNVSTPTRVADPTAASTTWTGVSAGTSHTCGVTDTGRAYCWGYNGDGRLGDGTTTMRTVPAPIVQ